MLRRTVVVAAIIAAATGVLPGCGAASANRTIRVEPGDSISDAVASARPGDVVLLAAGTYDESVRVDQRAITIRGEDRNAVVLDGQNRSTNGFLVAADGVAIENMTIHGYTQNGIVFNGAEKVSRGKGVDPSRDYGAGADVLDGYAARYITAYDNGLYGVYAFASRNGVIEDVYVSGHPDSGVYVGQCKPCNAIVRRVTAEHNAIGYYGTNASGGVFVVQSVFRKNRLGVAPNSQKAEKLAPQEETTVVGNVVEANDDALAPAIPKGFFGGGIAVGGGVRNLIARNVVRGNPLFGIGLLTLDAYEPDNNRIVGNVVTGNGVDLAYVPTGASDAAGNCFAGNTFGSSLPASIETLMPCAGASTLTAVPTFSSPPAPPGVDYRKIPAPGPQPTMPVDSMRETGGVGAWTAPDIDSIGLPS